MITYEYTARDPRTGNKIQAEVQAESERAAARLVKDQGYAPIEIKVKKESGGTFGKFKSRIKTKDRIIFARQLATLINAGLPLVQSLRTVLGQTRSKPLKIIISEVIASVEAGQPLSQSLGRYPKVFGHIFVSLVAAGEASGTLDQALERVATQQEKDAEIVGKVRGAMIYPAIVLLVMGAVMVFMMVSVLPQVEEVYAGIKDAQLPLITRVLLAMSNALIRFWWIFLIVIGVLGFFSFRWIQTPAGRSFLDRAKMRMPPFSQLFMKLYMARFARIGTTLVASGVPLIQMIEITAEVVNNTHIAASLNRAIDKVRGGKALSSALEGDENFLELVPNMLKIGEQSGAIQEMLGKTADYYEKEVDTQIKTISTLIEPLLMVVLGIVAFIIVAAILLPIYQLSGKSIVR